MVPTEYRLEQVTARLVERLEGTRRSYAGSPSRARQAFHEVAEEVVEDAIGEFTTDGFVDRPERQAALLRREVLRTFLPRYTRLATAMTAREEGGFGLGFLYGPAGRLLLVGGVVVAGLLLLRMPGAWGVKLAPMVPLILGIFVPDVLGMLSRRRYRADLLEVLRDMQTIQDRSGDYLADDAEDSGAVTAEARATARRPEGQGQQ